MSNLGHEGTRIRRDLGSVGFRLWRRFGYCRTGHNHGSANHDYDGSYYDCGTDNDHGSANHAYSNASANTYAAPYSSTSTYADLCERVRCRTECPREGGGVFEVHVVFS